MNCARFLFGLGAAALASAGCASHARRSLETDPAAIAAVHAELRVVNGESTWVARGTGYELIGRSKAELVVLPAQLEREAAMIRRVFPEDSFPPLVVTVRRAAAIGKPYVQAPPFPATLRGTVVELVLPDPAAKTDPEKNTAAAALGIGLLAERTPTLPVVRAWLAAHAGTATGTPARPAEATGEFEDPRVPSWAQEVVPSLTADSLVDRFTKLLAAHPDDLIPLPAFFTTQRPTFGNPAIAQRGTGGERGGGGGAGGRGGGGGGMGGRGGMGGGGRGGMGGRGGTRGGTASRSQGDDARGLQGAALFDAQSVLVGRYLAARVGYDVIGEMIDAQILSRPLDEALARHKAIKLAQMDLDWFQWLMDRSAALNR